MIMQLLAGANQYQLMACTHDSLKNLELSMVHELLKEEAIQIVKLACLLGNAHGESPMKALFAKANDRYLVVSIYGP